MKNAVIYYSVGPLLYCPANHVAIADSIITQKFGSGYSLALCLEDTIGDCHVAQAENCLIQSLNHIYQAQGHTAFSLPRIFIRIRSAAQMDSLLKRLGSSRKIVSGFIIPKLNLDNIDTYIQMVLHINAFYPERFYTMPILESPSIAIPGKRADVLFKIKERLKGIEQYILNIRVGGNDLCHLFGFRRGIRESIHDIRPICNIFADIITIFGTEYVISGPVWEYYSGDGWEDGLKQELSDDKLCGFVGKTAIHPKQVPLIRQAYCVSKEDLEDAQAVLGWQEDTPSFVSGSIQKKRMNEYKTHTNWAQKIIYLSEAYGVL
ncbi:MAG: HpcH/HpaI aldolase/citrate lyase family protein [Eubacterium sp.]|jgi:citrate lyase beta subunit|nr:HpcH/HpaI aldolase/citrate lyase family protein [Eubacterium sp.]